MVVSNKEASVKDCYVRDGNVVSWVMSVWRALRLSKLVERESLSSLLANVIYAWILLITTFGSMIPRDHIP